MLTDKLTHKFFTCIILCTAILFFIFTPSAAFGKQTYKNTRYGFSISYPSQLTKKIVSDNNDGARFTTSDEEMELTAYGSHDISVFFPQNHATQYFNSVLQDTNGKITSKQLCSDFFIIEYKAAGCIFYRKTFLSEKVTNTMIFSYPEKKAAAGLKIRKEIEKSFKPGKMN